MVPSRRGRETEGHATVVAHFKDHFLHRSETFIYAQLQAIHGYRPIVLDRYPRLNREIFPNAVHYTPVVPFRHAGAFLERAALRVFGRSPYLESIMRREGASLIHAHFGQLGALFLPVARRHEIPLIVSFYGKDLSLARETRWQSRFEALWRGGARFLALGPAMVGALQDLGCPAERIEIVPLGIDLDRFGFMARTPPVAGEPPRLLSVGRLVPKKGFDVLFRAAARLRDAHAFEIRVAGDGEERESLARLARDLDLQECVTFLGWLSPEEIAAEMAAAHLFVLASRTDPTSGESEGTPTVLLEAQARGLPVLSTRHADIPFIVRDGESGLLVAEDDAEAMADALDRMLRAPERWREWGESGRRLVASQHSMAAVGARLEGIYDACLRSAGGMPAARRAVSG